jgi:hypothetical protein
MMEQPPQQNAPLEQIQNAALNFVSAICSIVAMPVEILIRWQYGTRYFPIPVVFFSAVMMLFLPLFSAAVDSISHIGLFRGIVPPPAGMFGVGAFSSLYFFVSFLHGFRLWRRMVYMELEPHSLYEGPPLPFLLLVPGSRSFWFTRLVIEPALIFIAAGLLEHTLIIQSGLATYLRFAAIALGMKNFIGWYRAWEYLRNILDARVIGPCIRRLVEDKATDEDHSMLHLAKIPKSIPADIRQQTVSSIARARSAEMPNTQENTNRE